MEWAQNPDEASGKCLPFNPLRRKSRKPVSLLRVSEKKQNNLFNNLMIKGIINKVVLLFLGTNNLCDEIVLDIHKGFSLLYWSAYAWDMKINKQLGLEIWAQNEVTLP